MKNILRHGHHDDPWSTAHVMNTTAIRAFSHRGLQDGRGCKMRKKKMKKARAREKRAKLFLSFLIMQILDFVVVIA